MALYRMWLAAARHVTLRFVVFYHENTTQTSGNEPDICQHHSCNQSDAKSQWAPHPVLPKGLILTVSNFVWEWSDLYYREPMNGQITSRAGIHNYRAHKYL